MRRLVEKRRARRKDDVFYQSTQRAKDGHDLCMSMIRHFGYPGRDWEPVPNGPPRHPSRRAAWNRQKHRCGDCGGCMRISVGPGRTMRYRGGDGYEIPSDMAFPVCLPCGAQWITSEQVDRLGEALEGQREERLRP